MTAFYFELNQLSYAYADGTKALSDITLDIPKGKKIAILGHNGAGKSTLFQHLNGILKPTAGTIVFEGNDLEYSRKALKALRQKVGIVFQNADHQLFSGTVKQDIAFGPLNLGWSTEKTEEKIAWAVAQTEVEDLLDKPIHFLSVGQKKRVAMAGVLAMEPSVLLLDEPTAGLDNYYATQVLQYLANLDDGERTILLATHDIPLAYEWADLIIVMEAGKIIYNGDPITLFYEDELLHRAHLERPWIFEMVIALQKKKLLQENINIPRSKQELQQLIEQI
ncbi:MULTISPECIES: energy-coupling factor ABC transporter ATP-binding protein [Lysinibacillus]|uniref:energy-coupling factor ABC transporter ATP-binding protein n=1 Tax=Lysinibacillus TaxID=400634 RepID=UPI0021A7E9CD|nr:MULTISPECIES: ATP-binding cassette domain-containing protein [Lysinibacillus]MCT1540730.1 ATP-binding cassette domain-containing protein [Lysinibacillus capsici]MCT1571968.1 ATP-binding cassette domain-containing protein [Lysinibacillus capsici]MCT1648874.1 ATP-binding cassette domain-containing protein [Lysinibacillus capsici]MCT1727398.1 ATP-binding cassette domain-containing protein [Lysinibacillus capsici]MCT1784965.1 ATP-binding cassette domain-containing protein [Lysinibacillus capsic